MNTKRNLNRLEQKEYYSLYKWLETNVPTLRPGITREETAQLATKDLGFIITEWHVRGALETIGLSLPIRNAPVPQEEAIRILAIAVALLYNESNIPILDDLKRLL